jgi:predicted PurR-regulated permease PerM
MDHEPEYWPGPAGMMRTTILIIILLVVVWLSFLIFSPFFLAFATAAPIALLLFPTQERLAAGMGGRRRSLAAMLLVIWIALLVAIPLAAVLSLVGSQAVTFFSWVGPQLEPDRVQHFLRVTLPQRVPWFGAAWDALEPYLAPAVSNLLGQLSAWVQFLIQRLATGVGSVAVELFIFFLFLFFLLRDGRAFLSLLRSLSPLSPEQETRVIEHLAATTKGALLGILVVPIAQGALATIGYWLFGVPNALLWGAITVIACLIPLLGAPVAWIPITIFVFFTGPAWKGIGLLVYGTFVISGIDNILKPMLLSGTARVHPLPGFLCVVGGTLAFGPAGLLVGPVVLSLAISALYIYRTEFQPGRIQAPTGRAEAATVRVETTTVTTGRIEIPPGTTLPGS